MNATTSKKQVESINHGAKLKILYALTCILCVFMIIWILIFPSSWLMGRSKIHDRIIHETLVKTYNETQGKVPPKTITKYKGHSLVHFTHILPGCIWAGIIPFQLHPSVRQRYKALHKVLGYTFIITAIMIAFGVFFIFKRNLTFHNDYPTTIPPIDAIETTMMGTSSTILTIWYVYTAISAVSKARNKDYVAHKNFIIRNVGSGIWVALQRIIVIFCQGGGLVQGPIEMRDLFGNAAKGSIFITLVLSEYAVWLLNSGDRIKKNKVV